MNPPTIATIAAKLWAVALKNHFGSMLPIFPQYFIETRAKLSVISSAVEKSKTTIMEK